jgi:hypothetical protein
MPRTSLLALFQDDCTTDPKLKIISTTLSRQQISMIVVDGF